MNILVPVSWLEEYVTFPFSPEELAARAAKHGPSFERIEMIEGEKVFDIEITTNRVDAMSIKGLARELAAIIGDQAVPRKLTENIGLDWSLQTSALPLPKITVETDSVKGIVCVVLDQVKNQPSPTWLQKRLRQIGQNSHGIIIDMSNYVTHELGHPCHTFDYDKIMDLGGEIIVKQATAGKTFVTLDGESHQTVGGEVVFENAAGEIIDLPAIKGTANTAISEQTTRVLFWLENMEAAVVRQASMQHAIRTVAAVLNEKNVDPELMMEVLTVGTQLLQEYAGAKIASPVYRYRAAQLSEKNAKITLNLPRLADYLGVELPPADVRQILTRLGFRVTDDQASQLTVEVPSFRAHDVTMEADLIEEVARIYGYHNLPSRLDFPIVQIPTQEQFDFALESQWKHFLVANGWSEVYTYSMVAADQLTAEPASYLRLLNPLTEDKVYLRQSLVPSLQRVYQDNQVDSQQVAGVFELANVYLPGSTQDSVDERLKLAGLTTLPYRRGRWLVEQLLRLAQVTVTIDQSGKIWSGVQQLGQMTVVAGEWVSFEFDVMTVVAARTPLPVNSTEPTGPRLYEDMTFVARPPIGPLLEIMQSVSPLIRRVTLTEIYRDHYTFHFCYQQAVGELSSADLKPVRQELVARLQARGCELVGELPEV